MTWNITEDKIGDVAYSIRRSAVMNGMNVRVWVRDTGAVIMRRVDAKLQDHLLDDWLVGTYDRTARLEDIACDLRERLGEILSLQSLVAKHRAKIMEAAK